MPATCQVESSLCSLGMGSGASSWAVPACVARCFVQLPQVGHGLAQFGVRLQAMASVGTGMPLSEVDRKGIQRANSPCLHARQAVCLGCGQEGAGGSVPFGIFRVLNLCAIDGQ